MVGLAHQLRRFMPGMSLLPNAPVNHGQRPNIRILNSFIIKFVSSVHRIIVRTNFTHFVFDLSTHSSPFYSHPSAQSTSYHIYGMPVNLPPPMNVEVAVDSNGQFTAKRLSPEITLTFYKAPFFHFDI